MKSTSKKGNAAGQDSAAPAADTAAQTAQSTPAVASENAAPAAKKAIPAVLRHMPRMKKEPKAAKTPKVSKNVTGVTINVATSNYNNWRTDSEKWGLDELVNGSDKTVAKKARFIRYTEEEVAALGAEGAKWGGYISVAPAHVTEVVATLNKWNADNLAKPLFNTFSAEQVQAAYAAGQVQLNDQFVMLETFVEVQPKPRAKKVKTEAPAAETVTA